MVCKNKRPKKHHCSFLFEDRDSLHGLIQKSSDILLQVSNLLEYSPTYLSVLAACDFFSSPIRKHVKKGNISQYSVYRPRREVVEITVPAQLEISDTNIFAENEGRL